MFDFVNLDLPKLERETIEGVRYYSVPDEDELLKLVSITSITSHYNNCLLYTSPSPRDGTKSRMPSSA